MWTCIFLLQCQLLYRIGLQHTMVDLVDITYLTVAWSDPSPSLNFRMAQCNLIVYMWCAAWCVNPGTPCSPGGGLFGSAALAPIVISHVLYVYMGLLHGVSPAPLVIPLMLLALYSVLMMYCMYIALYGVYCVVLHQPAPQAAGGLCHLSTGSYIFLNVCWP